MAPLRTHSKVQSYIDSLNTQPTGAPMADSQPEPVVSATLPEPEPVATPVAPIPAAAPKPALKTPAPPKAEKVKAEGEALSGWKKFASNVRRFVNYVDKPPKE
jgi:hypothetical protein